MKTYNIYGTKTVNSNTAEHGFGDYPETTEYLMLRVEADTIRKAQNKAKKIDRRIMFGGMFGNRIEEATGEIA